MSAKLVIYYLTYCFSKYVLMLLKQNIYNTDKLFWGREL